MDFPRKERPRNKQHFVFIQQECVSDTRQFSCYIHGHSVKSFQRVVQICKRGVKDIDAEDIDVEDTKRNLLSPESAMFCAPLSHFGML